MNHLRSLVCICAMSFFTFMAGFSVDLIIKAGSTSFRWGWFFYSIIGACGFATGAVYFWIRDLEK